MSNDKCTYSLLKEQEIRGAGIIVPKEHRETIFEPDGYNVGWNCGHVGGQHVFHSHLHVIPRYAEEKMAGKGIRYLFKNV